MYIKGLVIMVVFLQTALSKKRLVTEIVCENEEMNLRCPKGHTIEILSATFGKKNYKYCYQPGLQVENCEAENTFSFVKKMCNLKQRCRLSAVSKLFGDPCVGTFKYLEVSYRCLKNNNIISLLACENDKISFGCFQGKTIKLVNALYGRQNGHTCTPKTTEHTSLKCDSITSLEILASKCDRSHDCSLTVNSTVFGDPCIPLTYKYLELDYVCISNSAIIIGVRKCGTRALLEMLYLHPGVQKAAGEVHFFDRDDNYNKGLDWYRKKMPHSFKGQITIEKSPSYFVTPEVPERIRAMNASVKLLLIVREPVTRAISDYTQLRSHAATAASPMPSAPAKTFEQYAIKPDGSVNSAYRPLALSLYHTFMHRWLEVFPRQQLLIVNGDRLIEDPVSERERIETFLGLEHRIGRHNFYFNRTKGFYCLRNDTADKCLRESKGRKHPRVDIKILTKLRRYYIEHNQKFYELVGEDLGWPEK